MSHMATGSDQLQAAKQAVYRALQRAKAEDLSWLGYQQTTWSLSIEALQFVWALIMEYTPEHVLELGAGESTRLLVRAAEESPGEIRISSIEHDPEYLAKVQERVGPSPPGVQFQLAPIVARMICERTLPVYSWQSEAFAAEVPPDLVLTDGPPVALGGREGTLYQIMDIVRAGTIVLLDDAGRKEEQTAMRRWCENLGDAIDLELLNGFPKGLAAIYVRQPIGQQQLFGHRLRLTLDELAAACSDGQGMILLDEYQWELTDTALESQAERLGERDTEFWESPIDDERIIQQIEKRRREGVGWLVVGWPAFWWLDCYPVFGRYLEDKGQRIICNERVAVFRLK
jgi:hypothetical protein